jgi:dCTP deaminase
MDSHNLKGTEMILSDLQIKSLAEENDMIHPYLDRLEERDSTGIPVMSYGNSSYGYDLRLSDKDFYIYNEKDVLDIVDPKNYVKDYCRKVGTYTDESGSYYLIPPKTYALGVSVERLMMPRSVTGLCIGKSTYARIGLSTNITAIEAGWVGHVTLEFFNHLNQTIKVYANEGVVQILFFKGSPCDVSYKDRRGKYQHQEERVVFPKVRR